MSENLNLMESILKEDEDQKEQNGKENVTILGQNCDKNCIFKSHLMRKICKGTTCRHKVPTLFQEPHIIRGYRMNGREWSFYFISIFKLHNETMNIWTHLIALIFMIRYLFVYWEEINFWSDPHTWTVLISIFSTMIMFLFSSLAHCIHSKCEMTHHLAYMLDYAGIGLYSLNSALIFTEYTLEDRLYSILHLPFYYLSIILGCLVVLGCCISKTHFTKPYPYTRLLWLILPVLGIYTLIFSSVAHRFYQCFSGQSCLPTLTTHLQHMAWFLISGFFFCYRFPENCLPTGLCDHFGASHQLFHTSVSIMVFFQMESILNDYKLRKVSIKSRKSPTFIHTFAPTLFASIFSFFLIHFFCTLIRKKLSTKRH